ncbi:MAG TPA: hypothetical protein VG917_01850 [Patescibacteria group bacterium]|nr:hypothetical protein [Patescibacteria group bacterium]
MANPEQNDFPDLPYTFEPIGITPDDVKEFSSMYDLEPKDTIQEIIDLNVDGRSIQAIQDRYSNRGRDITRREAAHMYYDQRFLNRTVDKRNQPEKPGNSPK